MAIFDLYHLGKRVVRHLNLSELKTKRAASGAALLVDLTGLLFMLESA